MEQMQKRIIRNPEKWVGRYVRHMANWQDFQWGDTSKYAVCEWTGKLMIASEDYSPSFEEREILGRLYDECYYYSSAGFADMYRYAMKHPERIH